MGFWLTQQPLRTSRAAGIAIIGLLAGVNAYGQSAFSASISGLTTDGTGANLPGVTITAKDLMTDLTRTATSSSAGIYRIDGLAPSHYMLTAELKGFATLVKTDFELNVGSVADIPLKMSISNVQQEITVSGSTSAVESTKADIGLLVTPAQIDQLPLNGRNFVDLTQLSSTSLPTILTTRQ